MRIVPSTPLAIARHLVAYVELTPAPDHTVARASIIVRDLKTGRIRTVADPVGFGARTHPENPRPVNSLVLGRNASVAWIAIREDGAAEVWRITRDPVDSGRLDEGVAIDGASLRLRADRTTLEWRHGGEIRTAALNQLAHGGTG